MCVCVVDCVFPIWSFEVSSCGFSVCLALNGKRVCLILLFVLCTIVCQIYSDV